MANKRARRLIHGGVAVVAILVLNGTLLISVPQGRAALLGTWDDVRKRQSPGFSVRTYIDEASRLHKYAVFVPFTRRAGIRPPVILYLNGLGQNGEDGVSPLANGLAPVIWDRRSDFPFVVVFTQCNRNDYWDADTPSGRRALAILDKTIEECDAARDQIFITGISAGGTGAWRLAAACPNRFAAVVPVSARVPLDAAEQVAAARLPVWSFCVRGDSPELVASNEKAHRSILLRRGSSQLTTLDGTDSGIIDQHDAWDFAFRDEGLRAWLLMQAARTRPAPGPAPLTLDEGTLARNSRSGAWVLRNGELLGRTAAGEGDAELSLGAIQDDWEFQVEFQMSTESRWELIFPGSGKVSVRDEMRLALTTSNVGGCGLYNLGTGRSVGLTNPAAQRTIATSREDWNHLRIRASDGRFTAWVNGRPLLGVGGPRLVGDAGIISLRIPAGQEAPFAWRHLRFSGHIGSPLRTDAP